MRITRKGARRDRGLTTIIEHLPFFSSSRYSWENNVTWNSSAKELQIQSDWVPHTDGTTYHTYTISLTLDDVSSLIGLLGHAGSATDAGLLRDHLGKHVPGLVKLLACAVGVAPVPLPEARA